MKRKTSLSWLRCAARILQPLPASAEERLFRAAEPMVTVGSGGGRLRLTVNKLMEVVLIG